MEQTKTRTCAYLQIAAELRQAIAGGDFPAGSRMPTIERLAERFNTSAFTIQSALKPLEREGLIEQKRRVGIFVRNANARLETLGIYYGHDIWAMEELVFCRCFHREIEETLKNTGVKSAVFMDGRPKEESGTPFQPLMRAIERGEIQALAILELADDRLAWLEKLSLPKASFTTRKIEGQVYFDMESFISMSLDAMKAKGRRNPAIISNASVLEKLWPALCRKAGLEPQDKWMRVSKDENITGHLRSFGYESFLSLWNETSKPDSIFLFPDTVASGAITGILSKGVKVPEELLVAMHRNEDIDCPCPFPTIDGVSSAQDAVRGMLNQISAAMRGEPQKRLVIPYRFTEHA